MSDHRWQGYSHAELYEQIHDGPGAESSQAPAHRWRELTRALGEVDQQLRAALTAISEDWRGAAADSARRGLGPLGDWAAQAQQAAEIMRDRAEQQAELISWARSEMPPPVEITTEDPGTARTLLTHLFGGQTDYEVEEARKNAAEQRAFDVMRTYEAATAANTTSLASFTPPPRVVVDVPEASGRSGASPGVTISWAAAPPPPVSDSASRGPGPANRGSASSNRGRTGRRPAAGSGGRSRRQHDAEQQHEVTEKLGRPGDFFEVPEVLSRPVIGE
ncbi:PPE domain-containing protein [Saccharopolyspora rectivirgula]|jgi:hypothetical protein|uniref:PPE domain-containing protein n=1 Tax=Saccharopolyspora rectivirgula TaxID=28042 RepID=UPI0024090EEA|nr:PPE domain-containing protein [Saccharopolyspora rectivirgula]